jgi:hypothetical protein
MGVIKMQPGFTECELCCADYPDDFSADGYSFCPECRPLMDRIFADNAVHRLLTCSMAEAIAADSAAKEREREELDALQAALTDLPA